MTTPLPEFPFHPREVARHLPVIGVGALVQGERGWLLGKRMGAHGEGTWSVPGGHMDHGETATETAFRETREETGLFCWFYPSPIGLSEVVTEGLHYVTLFVPGFAPHSVEPQICEPDKFVELRWVPWTELGSYNLFDPFRLFWQRHPVCPPSWR